MACRFGGRFVASSAVSNRLEKFASLRRKRSGEEEAELSEPDHERRLEEPEVLSDGDVAVVMSMMMRAQSCWMNHSVTTTQMWNLETCG